jgi:predicted nucleic acid-binding protein
MKYSENFVALLDANVLYPAPIRDILLHIAALDLFKPKWTGEIQREWKAGVLKNRPDLTDQQLQKTIDAMNRAFPDAEIEGYQKFIPTLKLPDQNDRHVLAGALQCNANAIITFNLKDFPGNYLEQFEMEALHPDIFIINMFEAKEEKVVEAFKNQVILLTNPPLSEAQVLKTLQKAGLEKTSTALSAFIGNE